MSAIKNGGPAFPQAKVTVLAEDGTPNEAAAVTHNGMTMRDYFAAKALPVVYSDYCASASKIGFDEGWMMGVAMDAYAMADAMLAASSAAVQPARPAPDAEGWIEWSGVDCPVQEGALVDVRHRDGSEFYSTKAGASVFAKNWKHLDDDTDIVAYRVVKAAP